VRRQFGERSGDVNVLHVEVTPGVVIVVASWMQDQGACAGMKLGAPSSSLEALTELQVHALAAARPESPASHAADGVRTPSLING